MISPLYFIPTHALLNELLCYCYANQLFCLPRILVVSNFHSMVFYFPGVPLPLYGMVAYGLVAILGLRLQLVPHNTTFDVQKKDETILIRITTSIDVATTYFLYVLSIEFGAESYFYCLTSSALTFSLFFIILKLGSDINTICGKRDHERVQSYGRFSGKTFTLLEKNSMELSGSRIVCIRKRIDVWARSS